MSALLPAQLPDLHVSASSLRTLAECPREFYYRYIAGLPREDVPARMVLGTAVHAALATFYRALEQHEPTPDLDTLAYVAGVQIASAIQGDVPVAFDENEGPEELMRDAERLLHAFLTSPFLPSKVLGVEMRFALPLVHPTTGESPYEEWLTGVFDLVIEDDDGTIAVMDHKISARFAPPRSSKMDIQMLAYAWAASHLRKSSAPVRLRHHVLLTTNQARVAIADIPRDEDDTTEFVDNAFASLEWINIAVTYSQPERVLGRQRTWRCGSCAYRRRCDMTDNPVPTLRVPQKLQK